jgi:hypothetical protein
MNLGKCGSYTAIEMSKSEERREEKHIDNIESFTLKPKPTHVIGRRTPHVVLL